MYIQNLKAHGIILTQNTIIEKYIQPSTFRPNICLI
jgi:hypothetical protein